MRLQKAFIVLTILTAALAAFVITANRDYACDDLFYRFIFDQYDMENLQALQPIESFGDIVTSQAVHYVLLNGRIPVHVIAQAFDAFWGYTIFGIFNAFIFPLLIWAIMRMSFNQRRRRNPWNWLIVLLTLLYVFPSGLNSGQGPWFGFAVGANYLWAGAAACWMTLFVQKFTLVESKSICLCVFAAIAGFFCGWSNEAFSVPLSGALFFLLLQNKHARNRVIVTTAVATWVGTAILAFAPGTLTRFFSQSGKGTAYMIFELVGCYTDAWSFWACIIIALIALKSRRFSFKRFYRNNQLYCNIWLIAVAFSIPAHSIPECLTFVDIISLVLLFRILAILRPRMLTQFGTKSAAAFIIIMALFAWHQTAIYQANARRQATYHQALQAFLDSPDGIFVNEYPKESILVSRFVDNYEQHSYLHITTKFAPLPVFLGRRDKLPHTVSSETYRNLIEQPDSFFRYGHRIPGSAEMYECENIYVSRRIPSSEGAYGLASFVGTDFKKSLSWPRRVVYSLIGNKKAPKPLESYVLHTRNGDYFVCEKILSTPSQIDLIEP